MSPLEEYQVEEGIHKNKFTGIFCDCEPETLYEILMYGPVNIGNNKSGTEMDIFNIKGLSDNDIGKMIYGKTRINLYEKGGIDKLNHKFSQAVEYYTKYLFKNIPKRIRDKKENYFNTIDDVIKFLRETETEGRKAQLHCNLAKTVFCVNDILDNPSVVELDKKSEYLIDTKIVRGLQIDNQDKKGNYEGYFTVKNNNQTHVIHFKMCYRGKQNYSLIQKIGSDVNYSSSELIKDGIGLEFEVENPQNALLLMQYLIDIVYEGCHVGEENQLEIKNKGLINQTDILELDGSLHKNYKDMLMNISTTKKDQTSSGYNDFKVVGNVLLPLDINRKNSMRIKHGVEIKIVLSGNLNETGINNNAVYSYYKKIQNVSRMQGYVTENYIKIIINKLLENYPEIGVSKEKLLLYYTSKCGLTEFQVGNKSNKFYTNGRGKVLMGTDFYPPEKIFTKNK